MRAIISSIAGLLFCSSDVFAFAPSSPELSRSSCRAPNHQLSLFRRRRKNIDEETSGQQVDQAADDSSRRLFLSTVATTASVLPQNALAGGDVKQLNLSDDDLKRVILSDINNDFLVTAAITRSIYDESATFTDEIDTYTMDKWVKGTQSLFISSGSRMNLVGDIKVTAKEVTFRFDEDLMFNIPFKPVVALTGKVVLTRASNGLITSYREYWDQSVSEVLKSAKFGKKA